MILVEKLVKTGVSLPEELVRDLEKTMNALGLKSRSQAIAMAVREFIARQSWSLDESRLVAGVVVILYDHTRHEIEEELTDIQHDFLDIIVSTLHVHISREECLEIIAVKGSVGRVKEILNRIGSVKGVRDISTSITAI